MQRFELATKDVPYGLLANLAIGDVRAFHKLQPKVAKAFPEVQQRNGDRTIQVTCHNHEVLGYLKALAPAAARGLALIANENSSSRSSSRSRLFSLERAVACVARCCAALASLSNYYTSSSPDSRRAQVEVAVLTRSAGLMEALPAATIVTAHILRQQQHHHQQQQQSLPQPQQCSHTDILDLAFYVLLLFDALVTLWPAAHGSSSSSSSHSLFSSSQLLSNAALPAAQLAVALLAAPGSSTVHWGTGIRIAVLLNSHLSSSIQQRELAKPQCMARKAQPGEAMSAVEDTPDTAQVSSTFSEPVKQLVQSTEFLQLLVAQQAVCLQRLDDLQLLRPRVHGTWAGSSTSSSSSSSSASAASRGGRSSSSALRQHAARHNQVPAAAQPGDALTQLQQATGIDCLFTNSGGFLDDAAEIEVAVGQNLLVLRYALVLSEGLQLKDREGSSNNSCSTHTADTAGSAAAAASGSSRNTDSCVRGNCSTGLSVQPPQHSALPMQQQQQQQQQQQAYERLLPPIAMLLLQLLCRVDDTFRKVLCLNGLLTVAQTAASVSEALSQSVLRVLPEPVLLQLLPHLQDQLHSPGHGKWHVGSSSSSTSAGGSSSGSRSSDVRVRAASSEVVFALEYSLSSLLLLLPRAGDQSRVALSLIISSNADVYLAAFEASLRCCASYNSAGTCRAVAALAEYAMLTAGLAVATEAASLKLAGCCAEQPQLLQQLLALQVTCLKCAQRAACGHHDVVHFGIAAALNIGKACGTMLESLSRVAGTAPASSRATAAASVTTSPIAASEDTDNSSSSSSGMQSAAICLQAAAGDRQGTAAAAVAAAVPCVAVLARSLLVAAAALQPVSADQSRGDDLRQQTAWEVNASRQCAAFLLKWCGHSGLPQGILQPLQLLGAEVVERLTTLHAAVAATDHGTQQQLLADAQQAGLQQQVRSYVQAVVARIPLSCACNNPGCVSLAQRSELVLVGGKSCVCGRCKAARYCCKACQVEHWPMHKALCKEVSKLTSCSRAD